MNPMVVRLFMILAAAGLALSVAAHGATFLGWNPQHVPGVWFLHIGIFLVLLPGIFAARRLAKDIGDAEAWRRIHQATPLWLKGLTMLFFIYAFFNFFFCNNYLNEGGVPGNIKGEFVLHNHGRVIRKMTPAEFDRHQAYSVRGFSGHWLVFYAAALMVLVGCERVQRGMGLD
jgi:hypothetical protein